MTSSCCPPMPLAMCNFSCFTSVALNWWVCHLRYRSFCYSCPKFSLKKWRVKKKMRGGGKCWRGTVNWIFLCRELILLSASSEIESPSQPLEEGEGVAASQLKLCSENVICVWSNLVVSFPLIQAFTKISYGHICKAVMFQSLKTTYIVCNLIF